MKPRVFELKPLSKKAIPRAIEKADRYRLLNEPSDAESICLDVLAVDPENQRARADRPDLSRERPVRRGRLSRAAARTARTPFAHS